MLPQLTTTLNAHMQKRDWATKRVFSTISMKVERPISKHMPCTICYALILISTPSCNTNSMASSLKNCLLAHGAGGEQVDGSYRSYQVVALAPSKPCSSVRPKRSILVALLLLVDPMRDNAHISVEGQGCMSSTHLASAERAPTTRTQAPTSPAVAVLHEGAGEVRRRLHR